MHVPLLVALLWVALSNCFCQQYELPNSGVVIGTTKVLYETVGKRVPTNRVLFKVTERIDGPYFCSQYEFKQPFEKSISSLIKRPRFDLVQDELSSTGRFMWKASPKEILSFVPDSGRHGTWLIGDMPERDNGWGYLKPMQPTFLPADRQGREKWHWNYAGEWVASAQTVKQKAYDTDSPVCTGLSLGSHMYVADRVVARGAAYGFSNSFILPPLSEQDAVLLAGVDAEALSPAVADALQRLMPVSTSEHLFWDADQRRWEPVSFAANGAAGEGQCAADVSSDRPSSNVVPFGEPLWVYLRDLLPGRRVPQASPAPSSLFRYVGSVVQSELLEDSGALRLFVRLAAADWGPHQDAAVCADGSLQRLSLEAEGEGAVDPFAPPLDAPVASLGAHMNPYDVTIEIDHNGVRSGDRVVLLDRPGDCGLEAPSAAGGMQSYYHSLLLPAVHVLVPEAGTEGGAGARRDAVEQGDQVWLWLSAGGKTFDVFAECVAKKTTRPVGLRVKGRAAGSRTARTSLVFSYAMSDRRDIMHRKMASVDADYLVLNLAYELEPAGGSGGANSTHTVTMSATLAGEPVFVRSMFNFHDKRRALSYLRQYLGSHEHKFSPQISSCYFYHAAVPFPQQLVYAAEVLCLLVGAKPVVMVSDHYLLFASHRIVPIFFLLLVCLLLCSSALAYLDPVRHAQRPPVEVSAGARAGAHGTDRGAGRRERRRERGRARVQLGPHGGALPLAPRVPEEHAASARGGPGAAYRTLPRPRPRGHAQGAPAAGIQLLVERNRAGLPRAVCAVLLPRHARGAVACRATGGDHPRAPRPGPEGAHRPRSSRPRAHPYRLRRRGARPGVELPGGLTRLCTFCVSLYSLLYYYNSRGFSNENIMK
jgi:hypothetical protein